MYVLARTPGGAPSHSCGSAAMRSELSTLVLPGAFCSGFPAMTSHPQAPHIPASDHAPVSLRHRKLTQVPEVIRALRGLERRTVICMKVPSPSQGMKRGRSGVGTLCSAVGPQKAGRRDMSTMAWSPLLLTLISLCTGDWMRGQGRGLGKTHMLCSPLSCLDPRVTISVSLPSRILGPGCADSAVLRVRVPGPEGLHHLLWKQQQRWVWQLCELVPTDRRIGPQNPHLWCDQSSLGGPRPILRLQVWEHSHPDHQLAPG